MKDDLIESEIQYGDRMCGIISFFAAIITSTVKKDSPEEKADVLSIKMSWIWLARILNLKPRRITPLIIHSFLAVCGHAFLENYRSQASKLLSFICNDFMSAIPEEAKAGKVRLDILLKENGGKIPICPGSALTK